MEHELVERIHRHVLGVEAGHQFVGQVQRHVLGVEAEHRLVEHGHHYPTGLELDVPFLEAEVAQHCSPI